MTFKEQFIEDLNKAKPAENLVRETLSRLTSEYQFVDVSNDSDCFRKGDIKAIAADNREIYIEVKNDSRIADTKRILCEDEVYYKHTGYCDKGNMHSDYDIYCIVSESENKIYVFDFKVLKEIYKKKGEYREIPHPTQETYCYLLELYIARRYGAFIATINYCTGEVIFKNKKNLV